jgi:CheY-like chemotaxis protein
MEIPDEHPAREMIEGILEAGQRGASLTRQLLAFSRKQVLDLAVRSLEEDVAKSARLIPPLIGEHIAVEVELDPIGSRVRIDVDQLSVVLVNLAANARDAMPDGGNLLVRTGRVQHPPSLDENRIETGGGRVATIQVTDSGCGIDPEIASQIFDPFFTTKSRAKGTGLGLSAVHGIVRQLGGDVTVTSEVGEGSTFTVLLPAVEAELEAPRAKECSSSRHAGESVLLVDDERDVRKFVSRILTEKGYRVTEAARPSDALRLFEEAPDDFDLLVTDLVMPEMNGVQLTHGLRQVRSGLKVLFISGYTGDESGVDPFEPRGEGFVQKSFEPTKLLDEVRRALDRRRHG